jgi:hypothetical protein
MRNVLVIATLLAFGCGQLRYASRTEMVEVAADPAAVAAAAPPRSVSVARARTSRTHALLIGGAIASVIGIGFIVGGAVGWKRQEATNAAADAQCQAEQGWFCGAFDDFSYLPYGALLGVGSVATLGGIVMLGLASNVRDRDSR